MKRSFFVLLICVSMVACNGCCIFGKGAQKGYVKAEAVSPSVNVLVPEYKTYVDNDSNLSPEKKMIKKTEADLLKAVVDKALENK